MQDTLKDPADSEFIKAEAMYLHSQLHSGSVYGINNTYFDEIAAGINEENFKLCPTARNMTPAWDLWHITRIEDITASILLCNDEEVFSLSESLSVKALFAYRENVGRKTKKFLKTLTLDQLSKTFLPSQIIRIKDEGAVIPETEGLMNYWGRKTVSGIITMPLTKHQIIHLNDCKSIVDKYQKRTKTKCSSH